MEKCLLFLSCISFATSSILTPYFKTKYRNDYELNRHTKAFYKLHIEDANQRDAERKCNLEGATLMVVSNFEDLAQAHAMMKRFPDIGEYLWIGADKSTYESAEENPIIYVHPSESIEIEMVSDCDILNRKGEIKSTSCFHRHPFICKVDNGDAPYDDQCDVYGFRYQYYSSVGSCYKVPLMALTWNEANAECLAEGAHLVILNSETEHQAVWDLVQTAPKVPVQDSYLLFVGIRALKPRDGNAIVFRTIFNESLQEAGYNEWWEEPNANKSKYCGAIYSDTGNYHDEDCNRVHQFVCEKEVPTTTAV